MNKQNIVVKTLVLSIALSGCVGNSDSGAQDGSKKNQSITYTLKAAHDDIFSKDPFKWGYDERYWDKDKKEIKKEERDKLYGEVVIKEAMHPDIYHLLPVQITEALKEQNVLVELRDGSLDTQAEVVAALSSLDNSALTAIYDSNHYRMRKEDIGKSAIFIEDKDPLNPHIYIRADADLSLNSSDANQIQYNIGLFFAKTTLARSFQDRGYKYRADMAEALFSANNQDTLSVRHPDNSGAYITKVDVINDPNCAQLIFAELYQIYYSTPGKDNNPAFWTLPDAYTWIDNEMKNSARLATEATMYSNILHNASLPSRLSSLYLNADPQAEKIPSKLVDKLRKNLSIIPYQIASLDGTLTVYNDLVIALNNTGERWDPQIRDMNQEPFDDISSVTAYLNPSAYSHLFLRATFTNPREMNFFIMRDAISKFISYSDFEFSDKFAQALNSISRLPADKQAIVREKLLPAYFRDIDLDKIQSKSINANYRELRDAEHLLAKVYAEYLASAEQFDYSLKETWPLMWDYLIEFNGNIEKLSQLYEAEKLRQYQDEYKDGCKARMKCEDFPADTTGIDLNHGHLIGGRYYPLTKNMIALLPYKKGQVYHQGMQTFEEAADRNVSLLNKFYGRQVATHYKNPINTRDQAVFIQVVDGYMPLLEAMSLFPERSKEILRSSILDDLPDKLNDNLIYALESLNPSDIWVNPSTPDAPAMIMDFSPARLDTRLIHNSTLGNSYKQGYLSKIRAMKGDLLKILDGNSNLSYQRLTYLIPKIDQMREYSGTTDSAEVLKMLDKLPTAKTSLISYEKVLPIMGFGMDEVISDLNKLHIMIPEQFIDLGLHKPLVIAVHGLPGTLFSNATGWITSKTFMKQIRSDLSKQGFNLKEFDSIVFISCFAGEESIYDSYGSNAQVLADEFSLPVIHVGDTEAVAKSVNFNINGSIETILYLAVDRYKGGFIISWPVL